MTINILTVKSESGDDYGPFLFKKKLTDKQLLKFLQKECPGDCVVDEEDEGPGFMGTYLHVQWSTDKIR
jgi:hypothetical protein